MTGRSASGMASFDQLVPALLRKWNVPGAAVAVSMNGRLVFARGYGWADTQARQPVEPDSLFRIASLSKPITAVAILKLVESRRLSLNDKAFRILGHLQPARGAAVDRRLYDITIRHLLQHTGGWDSQQTYDPMFRSYDIARAMVTSEPPGTDTIIRYMMGQPLQFTPGTRYAYSNFGYCVLGRVIEKVSGQTYQEFVKARVLLEARITKMRLGRSLLRNRAPGEVRYYAHPGQSTARSVFPSEKRQVPQHYGGWSLEAMDAHGGWLASTVDLLRFMTAVDGIATGTGIGLRRDVLGKASLQLMVARPEPPLPVSGNQWYGLGWGVTAQPAGVRLAHRGALPGTATIMTMGYSGAAWAVLFNSRPADQSGFLDEAEDTLWAAARGVKLWPSHDLFGRFDEIVILGRPRSKSDR